MQIISKRVLRLFWEIHPQAEQPLRAWFAQVRHGKWLAPADVKLQFGSSVDFVADSRIVFDLAGNKYRLVAHVAYKSHRVLVKFVGTHAQYDKINVEKVR